MSIICWIFLGLTCGFIASKVADGTGQGPSRDMALGVLGGLVGGVMFHLVGQPGITGLNPWSVFVSGVGAAAVLVVYHAVSGRRFPARAARDSQRIVANGKRELG